MVVVMKPGTAKQDIDALVAKLKELNLDVGVTHGVGCTILGLVGDTTAVDMGKISINPHVERVMRVQEPYKKANRTSPSSPGPARWRAGSRSAPWRRT